MREAWSLRSQKKSEGNQKFQKAREERVSKDHKETKMVQTQEVRQ